MCGQPERIEPRGLTSAWSLMVTTLRGAGGVCGREPRIDHCRINLEAGVRFDLCGTRLQVPIGQGEG